MTQVYAEALFVGLAILPTYFIARSCVKALMPNLSESSSEYVSIFLSGSVFHLVCEETGLNEWYVDNGAVVLQRHAKQKIEWEATVSDDLCDGLCGWSSMGGLCSHYSIHAEGAGQCSSCSA